MYEKAKQKKQDKEKGICGFLCVFSVFWQCVVIITGADERFVHSLELYYHYARAKRKNTVCQ